ncbi:MAG: beta-ketoacyl-ACP synthase III [Flavobacteriales bacterium]|jgi:3-oxoacyl-[acyl-carrier-protein] synthase-3|nr:beta-ketoacyl-ACP synthase III [Flavobacteriales bacterium]MBK6893066.1 beta-ketoacyl-ACP synthase III [Flavobacteriales bacterium]MBK7249214.1 beta-ketoacyl-ACP synthase III [Flavobacteriales bacterium]MBK9058550.1 beta-ketoacyl-ACP synthase III [Flavobacteriales bacterium]MBK9599761.1 beta-ketoacyl-ACP synthase III [Flavobacteriales bacterium]
MNDVFINRISKFLPNEPVNNEEMESRLGILNGKASRVRRLVLRQNRIQTRYYAIDAERNITHNNAQITKEAVERLIGDDAELHAKVDLLSCGTSSPDQIMPSHAAMVHGLLKDHDMEINSASGACCAGMNALRYGYLAVRAGEAKNAVCTGSERTSAWMRSEVFDLEVDAQLKLEKEPILAFSKEFLRWMLSDGAGAFLLQDHPEGPSPIRIDWIEGHSYAFELETCMYAGAEKRADGNLEPWSEVPARQWAEQSVFAMKQDVRLLAENILIKGVESMGISLKRHGVSVDDIDHFLPHISSYYFEEGLYARMKEQGLEIPKEKWFLNLHAVGNVGAASIYLMVEELQASGRLKKGDRILMSVPESARFSYFYAHLTVC